ncbi:MAG: hypothetical protein JO115_02355 [Pseudonocardiales bacterium]|nr:hypothetical protein [Pseudonocardiales bacterium]
MLMAGLVAVLTFGLVGGFVVGLENGFRYGLKHGFVYGPVTGPFYALFVGIVCILNGGHSRQPGWLPRNKTDIRMALMLGLLVGLVSMPVNWLVFVYGVRLVVGLVFVYVLVNILVFGISFWLLTKLAGPSTEAASSINPRSLWRRERRRGLKTGLVYGLTAGIIYGLTNGLIYGLVFQAGLTASLVAVFQAGLTNALTFGLGVTLVSSTTWAATLANIQLRHRGESSACLLDFLEDAHAREVLRSVGPVYQFRHARLQDRLAGVGEEVLRVRSPVAPAPG